MHCSYLQINILLCLKQILLVHLFSQMHYSFIKRVLCLQTTLQQCEYRYAIRRYSIFSTHNNVVQQQNLFCIIMYYPSTCMTAVQVQPCTDESQLVKQISYAELLQKPYIFVRTLLPCNRRAIVACVSSFWIDFAILY